VASRSNSGGSRIRLSFRTRLALVAAAAVGIAVAVTAASSFFIVRDRLLRQIDQTLDDQAVAAEHSGPRFRAINGVVAIQAVRDDGTVVVATDANTPIPVSAQDRLVATGQRDEARRSVHTASGHLRVLTVSVPGGAIQLAYSLASFDHTMSLLGLVLFLVSLVGVALALALGYVVAQAALRPVQRLTAAAEHVAATQQLDATIADTGDDELGRLARSFNAMLQALNASRRQQSQLVADAGHELRTPLTSLRTNIEVLAKVRDLPEVDREALLGDVTGQLEELTTLVGDLVELAREDETDTQPEDVRLDTVVYRALERARRRAPTLRFDAYIEEGMVRGQPVLLERAVLNLLDNAAKWSPPGGHVEVGLHRNGAGWQLDVRDHGPGIAPDDLPHVFNRFYRAPAARALPGSGLGLAIVRQVVESHGGMAQASCPPGGGALITVRLPSE
jgi:two-component system, OmpR family, sensor histidine kinase MprB